METKTCAYTNGLNDEHFMYVLDHFNLAKSLFKPIDDISKIGAYKIIISYDSQDKYENLMNRFSDLFNIKRHRFCLSADINDKNTSKADGVKAVLEHLNLTKENAYAFGDGENDATMLNAVGHGIAMGEHSSDIEKYAEFITKTVKEDGIFHALSEHYKLI